MNKDTATVLVVDDTPTKLYILSSWLRRSGHQVVQATGGMEALAKVRELRPDLVVLDVRLPDISGYEVCEQIKADATTSSIPVIQISGAAITPADRAQGLERGADAYLAEPVEPDEFTATVEATLRYYRARQRAELMAQRLAALTEVTLSMNSAETFDQLLTRAVEGTARVLGRQAGTLALTPDGRTRRFFAMPPGNIAVSRAAPPDVLTTLSAMSLGEAAGIKIYTISSAEWLKMMPDSKITGDVSAALCRTKLGRPPVHLGVDAGSAPLDADESNVLRQLGQALALAVDALRAYAEEHAIALTLQRSLLPARIPETPGLTISWRYQPAVDNVEVGGDFYEVLRLGHRVLIAIGDVQGHSLLAATVMAELRHALRASVIGTSDLGASMALLNEVLRHYHPGMTATVCLLLLDPATGEMEVANAGHIPPLLIVGHQSRYHRLGNLLLGVAEENYRVDLVNVPPGSSVLMFTDGLIEDRDKLLDESLEIVRHLAEEVEEDLELFSDRLIEQFGAREDDVALVMFRREG